MIGSIQDSGALGQPHLNAALLYRVGLPDDVLNVAVHEWHRLAVLGQRRKQLIAQDLVGLDALGNQLCAGRMHG